MQQYRYKAYEPGIKKQVIEMAINGSGIRDKYPCKINLTFQENSIL